MTLWQFLNDNFGLIFFIFVVCGGSIWAALQWLVKHWTAHQQEMQHLRNEELQLLVQRQQQQYIMQSEHRKDVPKEEPSSSYHDGYTPYQK